jgi:hypothetical protein
MLAPRRLIGLCALLGALVALPAAVAGAGTSEKDEVTKFARKKAVKEFKKSGFGITLSVTKASCSKKSGGYWSCKATANGGQCTARMRVYSAGMAGTKWVAPAKYFKGGCIADKVIAAGEDEGGNKALEKKVVVRYARLYVFRKITKGPNAVDAERDDVRGTCKRHKESTFWSCRFSVPSGTPDASCEATLRVYTTLGDPKASRYRVGCVL